MDRGCRRRRARAWAARTPACGGQRGEVPVDLGPAARRQADTGRSQQAADQHRRRRPRWSPPCWAPPSAATGRDDDLVSLARVLAEHTRPDTPEGRQGHSLAGQEVSLVESGPGRPAPGRRSAKCALDHLPGPRKAARRGAACPPGLGGRFCDCPGAGGRCGGPRHSSGAARRATAAPGCGPRDHHAEPGAQDLPGRLPPGQPPGAAIRQTACRGYPPVTAEPEPVHLFPPLTVGLVRPL